jgi:Tfp pilus assembly ATPase PilU
MQHREESNYLVVMQHREESNYRINAFIVRNKQSLKERKYDLVGTCLLKTDYRSSTWSKKHYL